MLIALRQLKRIWNYLSLREVFLKEPQHVLKIQCYKFCLFSSYNKALPASHYSYLHLLVLTHSTMFQIKGFHQDEWNPSQELHFTTVLTVYSRWYLPLISWSWTLFLLVFIGTCFDFHSYPTVELAPPFLGNVADISYHRCSREQFPLLMCIALFHHNLAHFHTLTGQIYVKNIRQRVRLLLRALCPPTLKYLTAHIALDSIAICKNTLTSMKALFYYM